VKDSYSASSGRAVSGEVEIEASPAAVWRALTDARELERWFPLEARVEPGVGGSIFMSWRNEYTGDSRILAWVPERHLRTTWGVEGEGDPDTVQTTDYRIEPTAAGTAVRVVTSGFPDGERWDDWVEGTRHGWRFELRSLKHYLERHAGRERGVVYLRRRVALSRDDAWARLVGAGGLGAWPLGGEPLLDDPPHQVAAVLPDLGSGVMRLSIDPAMGRAGEFDVTLWVSAWGDARAALSQTEARLAPRLERTFPEGSTP
jgi:uncharacterized protein YndB with AHSA1/START domain